MRRVRRNWILWVRKKNSGTRKKVSRSNNAKQNIVNITALAGKSDQRSSRFEDEESEEGCAFPETRSPKATRKKALELKRATDEKGQNRNRGVTTIQLDMGLGRIDGRTD
jgi:hypothetical protein